MKQVFNSSLSLIIQLFFFFLCSLLSALCLAQWQPDVRLTNNPAASYTSLNNAWCIASSGNVVHIVWYDNRDGNDAIYYKRSTDGGLSWGYDTRLNWARHVSAQPSVTLCGQVVHVVWHDNRDTNLEIYYSHSTDTGVHWEADTRLTNNTAISGYPSVTVSGQVVHVVWYDNRDGNDEIYYKRSTDAGVNWGADTRLTNNSAYSDNPSVTVSGQVVHVVWYDYRDGGDPEIYYKRSTDAGVGWGEDTRLTNDTANSFVPCVSVSGQVVHVVWEDYRDVGGAEIYYKRSTDAGVSWGADTRLTNNSAYSDNPSVTVSGQVVHVVWYDHRDGNSEIYYKRSTDGGTTWGADTRLTNNIFPSEGPSVSVSGQVVHVVWHDYRNGNFEIYYKRDPTGNPTGIHNISAEIPSSNSLRQNYPNPFNPSTNILFDIPHSSQVKLTLYDALGRELMELANDELKPGSYRYDFNAENLPSGVYFYRLSAGDYVATRKMVLIK